MKPITIGKRRDYSLPAYKQIGDDESIAKLLEKQIAAAAACRARIARIERREARR